MNELSEALRLLHEVSTDTHDSIAQLQEAVKDFQKNQKRERQIIDARMTALEDNINRLFSCFEIEDVEFFDEKLDS